MTDDNDVAKAKADAVKAVADTAGKAIDATGNAAGFFARFLEGPLQHTSLLVEDTIKHRRTLRLLRFADEMQHEMSIRGMTTATRSVATNLGLQVISAASVEDDNELQKRWAQLLVNAGDADSGMTVERSFVGILDDMSSFDAQCLEALVQAADVYVADGGQDLPRLSTSELPARSSIIDPNAGLEKPLPHIEIALGNLRRLGLVGNPQNFTAAGASRPLSCPLRPLAAHSATRVGREGNEGPPARSLQPPSPRGPALRSWFRRVGWT